MLRRKFLLDTAKIGREISNFTIGFATVSVENKVEDAACAGSGSLVTIGSLHGILTAAHVLDALPKRGPVGIVEHSAKGFQKQTITMEHTEPIILGGEQCGATGPDLAFLRLPQESVGWLKAQNSFYNLSRRRDDVLSNKAPTPSYCDTIVGMIHELTRDAPSSSRRVRQKQFKAIFCGARNSAVRYVDDYELFYIELTNDPGFALPESFEGTSGGALWRFYVVEKDDKPSVVEQRLLGVPFRQSLTAEGRREITCHGPKGIYGMLIDKVVARWPVEAKQVSQAVSV